MRRSLFVLVPLMLLALVVPTATAGNTKGAKAPEAAPAKGTATH